MPPHCDTMDGPVVAAAKRALEAGDVKIILPWAPKGTVQKKWAGMSIKGCGKNAGNNNS